MLHYVPSLCFTMCLIRWHASLCTSFPWMCDAPGEIPVPTIVGTTQGDDCCEFFHYIALTTGMYETSSRFLSILCRHVGRFGGMSSDRICMVYNNMQSETAISCQYQSSNTCKICYIKDLVTQQLLVTFGLLFPFTLFIFIHHRTMLRLEVTIKWQIL
jgi:hypothetical protein